jgi:hypothetical protein
MAKAHLFSTVGHALDMAVLCGGPAAARKIEVFEM